MGCAGPTPLDLAKGESEGAFRVLVADDNAVVRIAVRSLLEHCGCLVDAVSDGMEVLERITRREYDLVLLDMQMPGLDGPETAKRLRRLPRSGRPAPRLVAMTADCSAEDRDFQRSVGFTEFLRKPVRIDDLRLLLSRRDQPVGGSRVTCWLESTG